MQRRIEAKNRRAIWIEHIVWHAAAGAVLAVMVLVLLMTVKWLDEVSPRPEPGMVPTAPPQVASPAPERVGSAAQRVRMNRPSG